ALSPSPLVRSGRGWETTIDHPRDEFVPDLEIVEADANGVFEATEFRGRLKCVAANFYPHDPSGRFEVPKLRVFLPDGTPVPDADLVAAGIDKDDMYLNCGWQQGHTSMVASVEVDGLSKPLARNRAFLDADTHVVLASNPQIHLRDDGFCISGMFSVRHDARVLAVVDVAHGETRDIVMPLKAGEVAEDTDFRLRIHDATAGYISGSSSHSESRRTQYTMDPPYPDPAPSFSLILQVDPPLKFDSLTLEALDAAGNSMGEFGSSPWLLPIARFKGDLAKAVSLRVRYHPKTTRLLIPLGPVPGAKPAPANLFDVRYGDLQFHGSYAMRRFICEATELEMIDSPIDDSGVTSPIVLKTPTVRDIVEHYRNLPGNRKVAVDPAAMTVEFEKPKGPSLWSTLGDWLRAKRLLP
ncbi:MAG: hypothetical protein KDN05_23940, partial [Verrucomicrobiae bacterium]|nr:hypothetical protein [Verrucomicrobiae bacterium]